MPDTVIDEALRTEKLVIFDQSHDFEEEPTLRIINALKRLRDKLFVLYLFIL